MINVVVRSFIYPSRYQDSVMLMRISKKLEELEGVKKAYAMMATENNKGLFREAGLLTEEIASAGSNDLAIAAEVGDPKLMKKITQVVEEMLAGEKAERKEEVYKTLGSAVEKTGANFVLISVPGEFAAREARKALQAGCHVMIFSSNVGVEDEIALKKLGMRKNLLVMGPDCGTSIINGVGLGFSNVIERGPIGVVGASGTGIQEVTSRISAESGITQAIGTGSRDLSDAVGGITMSMGIQALAEDENTKAIVLISKPPSPNVAEKILGIAKKTEKPVVVNFIGAEPRDIERAGLIPAFTLEDAATKAVAISKNKEPKSVAFSMGLGKAMDIAKGEYEKLQNTQRHVCGLYSGGTFCYEALLLLQKLVGDVYSNAPLRPELRIEGIKDIGGKSVCIDLGAEEFVVGRPHPMIDMRLRQDCLLHACKNNDIAVILLDIVLGYGSHPDPAGELAETISEAKRLASKEGRELPVAASVCGTRRDPQNLEEQERKLRDAGVIVMPSNAQAVRMAALIASRGNSVKMIEGEKI